ncbi:MAG: beta strand repeat-containing protein, partial [Pirellula sp.]
TAAGTVTINITPVNDPPIAGQQNPPAVAHQRESYTFVESSFGFQDPVESHLFQSVILTSLPLKGKIKLNGTDVALDSNGVFEISKQDINDGKLTFMPGDDSPSENYTSFDFKVRDNGGTANGGQDVSASSYQFVIALEDYRGPSQSFPGEQLMDEDATLTFSSSNGKALTVSFIGDSTNQSNKTLTTTVSVGSNKGTLTLGSTPSGLNSFSGNGSNSITLTGSAADINAALNGLIYAPPANANSNAAGDKHTYTTLVMTTNNSQGVGTQWPQDSDSVDIGVKPINDAPVATGNATLTPSIAEDSTSPAGDTVSNLFGGNFSDAADAVGAPGANTFVGIALTGYARNTAKGEWQYSTNGTSWTSITSSVSDSASMTFKAADYLRFLPAANFNGNAPTLTVRLIESPTSVTTAATPNVSSNGGTTTISAGTVTLTHSVTAVNDAPIATGASTLTAILEDTTNPAGDTVSSLFTARFNDSADQVTGGTSANTLAGIAITSYTRASSKGEWQYSSNGTTWTTISSSITGDDSAMTFLSTDRLRFLPKTDFNGPAPSLTVRLLETPRSITTGQTVDVSTNGGATTISSGTVVLSHSVTPQNDAPVASGSATLTAINEDTTSPPGATVSSLFIGNFSDAKDQVIGGTNANNFLGVAVQVHTQDAARGYWEYTSDSTWAANPPKLATVSGNNAILLRSTDRIRFVPALNYNGPATPFVVRLLDNSNNTTNAQTAGSIVVTSTNGGTTEISEALVTLTHTVNPVNDPPITTNNTIIILEDEVRPLTNADFGNYSDVENQPFSAIKIVTRPAKGTLQYNVNGSWTSITSDGGDYSISDASIKFRYIPAQNENGSNYTTI